MKFKHLDRILQDMTFYINGSYVERDEAKISVLDLGLLRGYGIFEYTRTYERRPFHLTDHLLRLNYSAEKIGLALPNSLEEIEEIVRRVIEKSEGEVGIKMLVTGGISEDGLTPAPTSSLIIFTVPFKPYGKDLFIQGIHAATTSLSRFCPTSKTLHYAPAIMALQEGSARSAIEALFLNGEGQILEATTSNFFAFKGDTLFTCTSDEVLLGITQQVVLRLAREHYNVEQRALCCHEIGQIEEAFLTSSTREVMAIVKIDDQAIGSGTVGKRTKHLAELFKAYCKQAEWLPLQIPRYSKGVKSSVEKYFSMRSGKTVTT